MEEEVSPLIVNKVEPLNPDVEDETGSKTTFLQNIEIPSTQAIYFEEYDEVSNSDGNLEINHLREPEDSIVSRSSHEGKGKVVCLEDSIISNENLETVREEVLMEESNLNDEDYVMEGQEETTLNPQFLHVDETGQYIELNCGTQYVQITGTGEFMEIQQTEDGHYVELGGNSQVFTSDISGEEVVNGGEGVLINMQKGRMLRICEPKKIKCEEIVAEEDSAAEDGDDNHTLSYENEESVDNLNDTDLDADHDFEEKLKDKNFDPESETNCMICVKTFKTSASMKRHNTVCHPSKKENQEDPLAFELCKCCGEPIDSAHTTGDYKCADCDSLFVHSSSLQRHRSIEHSKDFWKCIECDKVFSERQKLIDHMSIHPLTKPYYCKECHREFSRKYHLDRHYSQTGCNGNERPNYKCPVCSKTFTRKDNLRDHVRTHSGNSKKKKIFICEYCNKEFHGQTLLVVHMRTHTGERPYPCDLCTKRFPSSGAMKKHRRMHTGEKPYECSECGNRFAAKETLNRHVRTHTGHKPHKCQFCGKGFIQAAQLRAHIFHHTGENAYTCEHCNRAFNRRARLTMHIKFVHEGADPLQCDKCDKAFYRKEDLSRHELLHSGVKPYECEQCSKRFAVKSSLKLHMLTHRKEQPCKCDECGRAFIRQDCLLRHMRAKHRDILEDIMASAEKKRIQEQLLKAASDAAAEKDSISSNHIWNELTLTDSIKELLALLVDEDTLQAFGWPDAAVDKILDSVIKRCGFKPASEEDFDYIGRLRENAKLLFTVVIDDEAVKSLLNNQTVDEVIMHVLRLAKTD